MTRTRTLGTLAAVVGFLAFVEFTSGVLQGYYTPMLSDIARHLGIHDADVNWLEGTQLMLSALVVPAFAKLGDMVGHKRMLLISTALAAAELVGRLGRAGIHVRRFAREPHWLRFGLPADDSAFKRVEAALS